MGDMICGVKIQLCVAAQERGSERKLARMARVWSHGGVLNLALGLSLYR